MARSALVACVLTASCSRPADIAAVDAAPPDVASCSSPFTFTPVTVTGTSPGGPLDVFHFAFAGFVVGPCYPNHYLINFTPTALVPACTSAPWLQLAILAPFTATGTNAATATLATGVTTDAVSFEASQLDPPDATPPHIVGHFVSNDPAWSFDIAVDLTSQLESGEACL